MNSNAGSINQDRKLDDSGCSMYLLNKSIVSSLSVLYLLWYSSVEVSLRSDRTCASRQLFDTSRVHSSHSVR
jgi:hypothetical protein